MIEKIREVLTDNLLTQKEKDGFLKSIIEKDIIHDRSTFHKHRDEAVINELLKLTSDEFNSLPLLDIVIAKSRDDLLFFILNHAKDIPITKSNMEHFANHKTYEKESEIIHHILNKVSEDDTKFMIEYSFRMGVFEKTLSLLQHSGIHHPKILNQCNQYLQDPVLYRTDFGMTYSEKIDMNTFKKICLLLEPTEIKEQIQDKHFHKKSKRVL